MFPLLLLFLVVFVSAEITRPVIDATNPKKTCLDINLPYEVDTSNLQWGLPKFGNNFDVTALVAAANRRDFATNPVPLFTGVKLENTKVLNVAGTFCFPTNRVSSTVIVATHGLTFDRNYWSSPYQSSNYSFVDFAINKGYSVYFYDRLGAGKSSKLSGYSNQASIQVGVLEQIAKKLRAGGLDAIMPPFKKLVLISHSYGSIITNSLLSSNPGIADAAILTGWGYSFGLGLTLATVQLRIANALRPEWSAYDSGYLAPVDVYSAATAFYTSPNFDLSIAKYFYQRSSPLSIVEAAVVPALNYSAPNFKGPLMFLIGETDYVMCGGNCRGVFGPPEKASFSSSSNFEAYIHPNTGHNINLHYNATGAYKVATDFLEKNGL